MAGEIEWIAYARSMGIHLYNSTNGGEGITGHKHSEETLAKMRAAHKGKVISQAQRKQISQTLRARAQSPEGRAELLATGPKISARTKGKPKPPRSAEHCRKLSEYAKIRPPHVWSDASREKARIAALARPARPPPGSETREKIIAVNRRRWKRYRFRKAAHAWFTRLRPPPSCDSLQPCRTSPSPPDPSRSGP